jgi:transglutaminase-like putative cysteine protease
MHLQVCRVVGSLAALVACALAVGAAEPSGNPKVRRFRLSYAVSISGLDPLKQARVWMPIPPNNDQQRVFVVGQKLPGPSQQGREKKYANDILFFETSADSAGRIDAKTEFDVTRHEVCGATSARIDDPLAAQFLKPDARVPIDGKPLTLLAGKNLPADQHLLGRALYDLVNGHMRYSKEGTGWGQGDAVWACDNKYGNCSDFHSLFISLSRSQGVPAKFEIGFPLPVMRGRGEIAGYHCWAWFKPRGRGWVPVDISEANKNPDLREYYFGNLTENRVTFSTGRDLVLEPPQSGPPLNFFIAPYVEVGGKPYATEKVKLAVKFEDLAAQP